MKKLFYLLFVAAMIFSLPACEIEEPDISDFTNFKLGKINGKNVDVSFDVKIDNPNTFGFKLKRGNLDVTANAIKIGVITFPQKIKVKKKSDKSYHVPLKLLLEDGALMQIMKLSTAGDVIVKIDGKVRGSVFGIGKTMEVHETKTVNGKDLKLGM